MQRYSVASLLVLLIGAAFWAYAIADSLIREFHKDVTFIDLGVLYILGLISGIALGLLFALIRRKGPSSQKGSSRQLTQAEK